MGKKEKSVLKRMTTRLNAWLEFLGTAAVVLFVGNILFWMAVGTLWLLSCLIWGWPALGELP